MDWLLTFVTEHAQVAHWVFFSALILAGFNIPISEDLILIFGGVLASTTVPENAITIFLFCFAGAYISDWIAYWIGRLLGPKLWKWRWFARTVPKERFRKIESYYQRYGMATLLVGRFIPFGVRNCLFMTAGMAKMAFWKFLIADGIACITSNSVVFWTAYTFGRNYHRLIGYIEVVDIVIFSVFLVALIGLVWYKWAKRSKARTKE